MQKLAVRCVHDFIKNSSNNIETGAKVTETTTALCAAFKALKKVPYYLISIIWLKIQFLFEKFEAVLL